MPNWKKVIVSGSDTALNSLYAPSITGSLLGTASYAIYAETASYSERTTQTDVLVLNQSGNNIAKGVVVRITGSNNASDIPRVVTASYENDNNSANTLGVTTQLIANGAQGYVITEGVLIGVDTTAFASGQLLYLGPTGSIIGTAPVAPLHSVRLGEVIREQQNNGSIYVRIDNGYEIGELHDVRDTTTSTSYGDLLIKSASVWTNSKQLSGSYAITGSLNATSFTGSLLGTASYATQALSASYAPSTPAFPYTGSAEITGSLGITGSFSTQTFDGTNYVTAIEVTDFKRNINDVMGTSSIDADGRTLSDGAANVSVNWETRTLANSSGVTYVDWQNRYLYGPGPLPTSTEIAVDWSSRQLTDNNGNIILDWQNATFTGTASFATSASWAPGGGASFPYTGSAEITGSLGVTGSFSVLDSIDAANKILIGSGPIPGSTEDSVNWDSRTLFDSNGNFSVRWGLLRSLYDANASQSVDWNNRLLKFDNGPGDYTVNWSSGLLRDTGSNSSVDWQNRITIDTSTKTSIDWQNRQLKDSSGNENLNWSSGIKITGSALVSGSLTVTGSLTVSGSSTFTNIGPAQFSGSFGVQGALIPGSPPMIPDIGPYDAIRVDDVNYVRKLYGSPDFGASASVDFGNRDLSDATGAGIFNWSGFASTIDSRLYINQAVSSTSRDALITNIGTGGHLLNEVTFDATVNVNDLCYLDTTNVWFPVDQGTNSASRLLGICMGYDPMTYVGQVLLEGDVVVTTNTGYPYVASSSYGLPVYIKESAGTQMSTVEPATGTVRRLGYCYHSNGGTEWIMKFRPSNDWA